MSISYSEYLLLKQIKILRIFRRLQISTQMTYREVPTLTMLYKFVKIVKSLIPIEKDFEFKSPSFHASCDTDGCQIDHVSDGPVDLISMSHIIPYTVRGRQNLF